MISQQVSLGPCAKQLISRILLVSILTGETAAFSVAVFLGRSHEVSLLCHPSTYVKFLKLTFHQLGSLSLALMLHEDIYWCLASGLPHLQLVDHYMWRVLASASRQILNLKNELVTLREEDMESKSSDWEKMRTQPVMTGSYKEKLAMCQSLVQTSLPHVALSLSLGSFCLIAGSHKSLRTKLLEAPALFLFVQRIYEASSNWRRATILWTLFLSVSVKSYKVTCLQSNLPSIINSQNRRQGDSILEITA